VVNMEYMFGNSKFGQDISDWHPKKIKNRTVVFADSQLEKEHRIPYWVSVKSEFLEQAVNAYGLHKKLKETIYQPPLNALDKVGAIKL